MLPFDALLKRVCIAVIDGLLVSIFLPVKWSVFVAVVALYVLLIVHTKPVTPWPSE